MKSRSAERATTLPGVLPFLEAVAGASPELRLAEDEERVDGLAL